MASKSPSPFHDRSEHCSECERETQHAVGIEIRTESSDEDEAGFSREPYRVATCVACQTETVQRMNNA